MCVTCPTNTILIPTTRIKRKNTFRKNNAKHEDIDIGGNMPIGKQHHTQRHKNYAMLAVLLLLMFLLYGVTLVKFSVDTI